MPRLLAAALALIVAPAAFAEHAKITLDVESGGRKQTAFVDQTPPASGKNPRPVLTARAGDPIRVQWIFTNTYPNKTIDGVVMHFFIAPAKSVGQKDVPTPGDDVVIETAFDLDFKPGAKAGGRHTLRIDKPGVYLVRVESIRTRSDHEHFAAIDLVVAPAGR